MEQSNSIFFQHPMNRLMLEGGPLPKYDPQALAMKYIELAKSGKKPTEAELEAVRTGVIDFCRKVHGNDEAALQRDIDGIETTWPEMHERFANSLGLTQLMLDCGMNSRYFYQYLYVTGKKFYGVALAAKDGYAVPVSAGKMEKAVLEKVPEDDWMIVVCVEEPSHPGRRFTDGAPQSMLRKAPKIFEAGAGLLSAYWNYGYPLGADGQRIVACDNDKRLLDYLPLVFERPLEELGIEYISGDLMEVMARPEYVGQFDVVRMTGLLSYFPDPAEKLQIMQLAQRMLNPNGVIVADEWVMGPSLVRTAMTTLWPIDPRDPHRLAPADNQAAAVASMGESCKQLGQPYIYVGDYCNGNPLCWTQEYAIGKCVLFLVGENATPDMLDLIPGSALPRIAA